MFVLRGIALAAAVLALACGPGAPPELDFSGPTAEWPFWGGDIGASHFSPATQIDPSNVAHLEVGYNGWAAAGGVTEPVEPPAKYFPS